MERRWSRRGVLTAGAAGAGLGVATSVLGPEVVKFLTEPREIKEARRQQKEAQKKDEFLFPIPEVALVLGADITDNAEFEAVYMEFPYQNKGFELPSLVDGTIIEAETVGVATLPASIAIQAKDAPNQIWIIGSWAVNYSFLVKPGDKVKMGNPILDVTLGRLGPEYKSNISIWAGDAKDLEIISTLGAHLKKSVLSKSNIIKDPRNPQKYLTIPVVNN